MPRPEPEPLQPQKLPVAPEPRKPRWRWLVAVLVLAAAGAAALYLRQALQSTAGGGPPVASIPTVQAAAGPFERVIRLAGTTAAKNYAILKAPQMRGGRGSAMSEVTTISSTARSSSRGGSAGGGNTSMMFAGGGRGGMYSAMTIVSLITPGVVVKKDTLVAEFDREEMLTRVEEFRTRVQQNDANMASVKAQLEVLEKDHEQSQRETRADVDTARLDLKTNPVRSAIQAETYRLTLEENETIQKQTQLEVPLMKTSLQAQWRLAELARDEGRAELKRSEANAEKMVLRAPMDGLVVMMTTMRPGAGDAAQIKNGDQVGPGTPIMQIVDLGSMIINASVNQVDGEEIRVGAKAHVRFDAYPGLELPAEVTAIAALPKASTFRAEYVGEVPVTLRLLKTDPRVIPDLSVSADVVLDSAPEAILVPRESVFRDGPESKPYVFVQQPTGWVRRDVELGKTSFVAATVRSGVKSGDVLATVRPPLKNDGKTQP
jgi:HlyD family secretion protein